MKSRSGARRLRLGLLLATVLALAAAPAAGASAFLRVEPFPGATATRNPATDAPTVTLNQPVSPSNDTTPSFSGTASDVTLITVNVYAGESPEVNPIATLKIQGTGGGWASANVNPPLANGTYTAVATQPSSSGGPLGASASVTFEVNTQSPTVTLETPPSPSNDTTPVFSGKASDATQVTVEIFEGARPEGDIVATATAQGTGGGWTSGQPTPALPSGRRTFTAFATQTSEIGNASGRSAAVTFVIDTEPPIVTLNPVPSPSNDTTPSFSGTASEATQVTVEIFEGPTAEGTIVATATANGTGGSWSSGDAMPALPSGTFTALAVQPSSIENPTGESAPVTFSIDTSPPTVTLNAPPSPSGNTAPAFSGTASDETPVTVDIYAGAAREGPVVASAEAEADRGEWVSARAKPSLPWGEYTAVATQPSSIGNPGGASSPVTFSVEPIAPKVATEAPAEVARTSAALYASVEPEGASVSACYFEYGTTSSYGTQIECGFVSGISAFPPSSTAAVPVFARIYGLSPSITYHFRIVVVGEGGTGYGADETFSTQAPWTFNEGGSSGQSASQGGSGIAAGGVEALIARQLGPLGRIARIGSLLRGGAFKARFNSPEAGTAVIDWYYHPPTGKSAHKTARPPVLIASGARRFHAAGTAVLEIRLTGPGRRLLKGLRQIRLTATCVLTPTGEALGTGLRTSATFELRR